MNSLIYPEFDFGTVFNIQRYSLHDGPGIRTVVFLKGCVLHCAWCSNPESIRPEPELMLDPEKCIGCGRCQAVCPAGGLQDPLTDKRCVRCMRCVEACPVEARRVAGEKMSVDEVVHEVERDRPFYSESGGGVTLSGGELLVQWRFSINLLNEFKKAGLHRTIETTGQAPWEIVKEVVDLTDLVYYDIKHMDPAVHKQYTGLDNARILENGRKLAREGKPMVLRVPLIGGMNNSRENIGAIVRFALDNNVREVHLLPYHTYAQNKYKLLNRDYIFDGYTPDDNEVTELKTMIESRDITVKVGG